MDVLSGWAHRHRPRWSDTGLEVSRAKPPVSSPAEECLGWAEE